MSQIQEFPTLEAALVTSKATGETMEVDIDGEFVTVHPNGDVETTGGTLAPIPPDAASLPEIAKGTGAIRHNFDGDAQQQWRLSALCTNGQSMNFDDLADGEFAIRYWYVHNYELDKPETNSTVTVARVVFLSPDFRSVQFSSAGILDGLRQLVEFMGEGPYDPPLLSKVRSIKTKGGSTYSIEPVEEDDTAPAA